VRVDDSGDVARRAGAFGVRTEQGGLDAVGLGEGPADRFEQAGVGGRMAASGSLDRWLIDHRHGAPTAQRALDQAALAGTCDTGDDGEHAERQIDVDIAQIVCRRSPDLQGARGLTYSVPERGGVSEVATGQGVAATQLVDGAGE